jgi:hypothetical protein
MVRESATARVRGQVTNYFVNCHINTKSYAADEAAA